MPSIRTEKEAKRWQFIEAVLERKGSFASVCRAHRLSRPCGYRWWRRFKREGRVGLRERAHQTHGSMRLQHKWRTRCERLRRRHPYWGAMALRALLRSAYPRQHLPSNATIARWLVAAKLVPRRVRRSRRGPSVPRPPWRVARRPNDVWTIDFKGRFRTGDGAAIEPLTVRDLATKFVLAVAHLPQLSDRATRPVLQGIFQRWGLPRTIHVDNGAPFAGRGALGLSTLSVWWLRLGIEVEFSRRARPGDNAGHEHMHGILKKETARPPAANRLAQQRRFHRWRQRYNQLRPHRALQLGVPASRYRQSLRRWPRALPPWHYPKSWTILQPGQNGRAWWGGRQRFIGRAFAHERLGLSAPANSVVFVYLGPHLIGSLHHQDRAGMRPAARRFSPITTTAH